MFLLCMHLLAPQTQLQVKSLTFHQNKTALQYLKYVLSPDSTRFFTRIRLCHFKRNSFVPRGLLRACADGVKGLMPHFYGILYLFRLYIVPIIVSNLTYVNYLHNFICILMFLYFCIYFVFILFLIYIFELFLYKFLISFIKITIFWFFLFSSYLSYYYTGLALALVYCLVLPFVFFLLILCNSLFLCPPFVPFLLLPNTGEYDYRITSCTTLSLCSDKIILIQNFNSTVDTRYVGFIMSCN